MARKFVVIEPFKDLQDKNHIYKAGKFYPREGAELDEARADALTSGDNAKNEIYIVEVLTKDTVPVEKDEVKNKEEKPKKETKKTTKK